MHFLFFDYSGKMSFSCSRKNEITQTTKNAQKRILRKKWTKKKFRSRINMIVLLYNAIYFVFNASCIFFCRAVRKMMGGDDSSTSMIADPLYPKSSNSTLHPYCWKQYKQLGKTSINRFLFQCFFATYDFCSIVKIIWCKN